MRVDIGDGVRIFFEVAGYARPLSADGARLDTRPTILLLHGGPGGDHTTYKAGLDELADIAHVVMYDHRSQGRSDRRPPEEWSLDTWADDMVRLCDALEIEQPIVFGNSFGGMVAMRYLARHPEHPSKVVLSSTAARLDVDAITEMFRRLGGDGPADLARRFWTAPSPEVRAEYLRVCGPLYTQTPGNIFDGPTVAAPEVTTHFINHIQPTMNLLPGLAAAACPVLILAGELDPVCPMPGAEAIAAALPPEHVQLERFAASGHGVFRDEPQRAMQVLRDFITA